MKPITKGKDSYWSNAENDLKEFTVNMIFH